MSSFLHPGLGYVPGLFGTGPVLATPLDIAPDAIIWVEWPEYNATTGVWPNNGSGPDGSTLDGSAANPIKTDRVQYADNIATHLSFSGGGALTQVSYVFIMNTGAYLAGQEAGLNHWIGQFDNFMLRRAANSINLDAFSTPSFLYNNDPSLPDSTDALLSAQWASGDRRLYLDSTLLASDAVSVNAATIALTLNSYVTAVRRNGTIGVYGLIVVPRAFTNDDERQQLEGSLAHRLNKADLLPIAHPYKDSPPTL